MSTLLLSAALLPLTLMALWHLSSTLTSTTLSPPASLRNKRIILLIAHPDDEAMFFSPSLLALTDPSLGNHLKILCLSTGDADGLGKTRKQELISSALTLGVRRKEDVFVMDDQRFRDGMKEDWKAEDVCKVLGQAFAPQIISSSAPAAPPPEKQKEPKTDKAVKRKSKHSASTSISTPKPVSAPPPVPEGPRATIDVLLTFDSSGISSHPNHISLHAGAHLFLSRIMIGHVGYTCPVTLYTLPTINIARKYSFVLDTFTTLVSGLIEQLSSPAKKGQGRGFEKGGDRVMFVNDVSKYWKARRAMVSGHKSQMVWFRWGWISLGRYMVVNDLRRERVRMV